jgi:hypothetical protein
MNLETVGLGMDAVLPDFPKSDHDWCFAYLLSVFFLFSHIIYSYDLIARAGSGLETNKTQY